MDHESKTARERSSRWLMIVIGLLAVVLAAMAGFALLNVQKPLTVDEQALLGKWKSHDPEYQREFFFKPDRTCQIDSGVEGNPPWRWKMDGPFLVVKERGGKWERIGPIHLDGDKFRLNSESKWLQRVEEPEADNE